jgi:LacI family transcriptional regulator
MATIHDVAQKAGVSTTTVSHVINGTRYVSDQLKEQVQTAMTELNYQPNGLARSLRVGRSKTIGLILPDNSNSFFAEISRYVEDFGYQNGYSVILCNTDEDPDKEASYINVLVNKQVEGIIFISSSDSSYNLSSLIDLHIPFVIVDRELPGINVDTVLNDNWLGGTLAANYLLNLGHRQIACISGASTVLSSKQRVDGFKQVLSEAGVEIHSEYFMAGDFHFPSGLACMDRILELASRASASERPTAVFVCNDMMALGAIHSAREHGLHIPDDISIIGFDNINISELVYPKLTTIAQPTQELAETAVRLLLHKLKKESTEELMPNRIYLKPHLVERESCTAPKGNLLT